MMANFIPGPERKNQIVLTMFTEIGNSTCCIVVAITTGLFDQKGSYSKEKLRTPKAQNI